MNLLCWYSFSFVTFKAAYKFISSLPEAPPTVTVFLTVSIYLTHKVYNIVCTLHFLYLVWCNYFEFDFFSFVSNFEFTLVVLLTTISSGGAGMTMDDLVTCFESVTVKWHLLASELWTAASDDSEVESIEVAKCKAT